MQSAPREMTAYHRGLRAASWRLEFLIILLTRSTERAKQLSSRQPVYKLRIMCKRSMETVVQFYYDVDNCKTQDVP